MSGVLPPGWGWSTLPELAGRGGVFIDGDWVESKDQDPNGEVRLVQLADVGDGYYRDRSDRFLTKSKATELNCTFLSQGDVLISRLADPIGRACIFPGDRKPSVTVVDVAVFRAGNKSPIDHNWLKNSINARQFRSQVNLLASGTTRKRISRTNLGSIELPVPPLNEQKRIVAKLDALQARSDAARQALDAIPPLLEKFRQSVLAAAFRGDLTREWRARNPDVEPATELLARIRAERRRRWEEANPRKKYVEPEPVDPTNLPDLPEGWCWTALEELAPAESPIVYGIVLPGDHVPDGVPFVRPADIKNGTVDFQQLPRTSSEIAHKYRRAALEEGDLMFSIVGTIGKWLVVPALLNGANITQSSVRIRPLQPLDAEYILRALESPVVQVQMGKLLFGNAVQRLNVEHVRRLAVPIVPTGERNALLRSMRHALSTMSTTAARLSRLKGAVGEMNQSILAKAFRGELVPQDPNDEPASVLLERIRAERADGEGGVVKKKRGRAR